MASKKKRSSRSSRKSRPGVRRHGNAKVVTRRRLGEMMSPWGGDAAYGAGIGAVGAVGSFYLDGAVYPDRAIVARALKAITTDIPRADRGESGWTKKDARDLRTIAGGLRHYMQEDYGD